MFSKRLIFAGVVAAAGTLATAGAYASAASTPAAAKKTSDAVYLVASLQGRNEVPGTKGAVDDPNGKATELLKIQGSKVTFAVHWSGITAPTEGHIHAGGVGVNGDVKVELFASRKAGNSAHGSVTVKDKSVLDAIVANPGNFYANLHTKQFPGGALRGQLHKVTATIKGKPQIFSASVRKGSQIYACTKQQDGTYAFTQHNVSAFLQRGIRHTFVKADAGPPQWVAPDRSSVSGAVVTKIANGDANIPELDLKATQTGAKHGLLAKTAEVMRLNTVHGVAPKGTCDPASTPTTAVPYQADYLFIG